MANDSPNDKRDEATAIFEEFLSKQFGDRKPEAELANMRAAFALGLRLSHHSAKREIPAELLEQLLMWTKQVSEQPRERVAMGIAAAALGFHDKLCQYVSRKDSNG